MKNDRWGYKNNIYKTFSIDEAQEAEKYLEANKDGYYKHLIRSFVFIDTEEGIEWWESPPSTIPNKVKAARLRHMIMEYNDFYMNNEG